MAIYRRDRNFAKIMGDVSMETVPVHFIQKLRLTLEDGTVVQFENHDLDQVETIEEVLMGDYPSPVVDMHIELDFEGIEEDVTEQVNQLLSRNSK